MKNVRWSMKRRKQRVEEERALVQAEWDSVFAGVKDECESGEEDGGCKTEFSDDTRGHPSSPAKEAEDLAECVCCVFLSWLLCFCRVSLMFAFLGMFVC